MHHSRISPSPGTASGNVRSFDFGHCARAAPHISAPHISAPCITKAERPQARRASLGSARAIVRIGGLAPKSAARQRALDGLGQDLAVDAIAGHVQMTSAEAWAEAV